MKIKCAVYSEGRGWCKNQRRKGGDVCAYHARRGKKAFVGSIWTTPAGGPTSFDDIDMSKPIQISKDELEKIVAEIEAKTEERLKAYKSTARPCHCDCHRRY